MESFKKLKEVINSLETDAEKFYNLSNSAAGTRLRKGMMDMKNLASDIRKEITELKAKVKLQKLFTDHKKETHFCAVSRCVRCL